MHPRRDLFPDRGGTALHRVRWVWAVYAALFALSVPWYLRDPTPRIWLGLPHWVVLSLAATLAVALFTVFVVTRYWPAAEPDHHPGADRR